MENLLENPERWKYEINLIDINFRIYSTNERKSNSIWYIYLFFYIGVKKNHIKRISPITAIYLYYFPRNTILTSIFTTFFRIFSIWHLINLYLGKWWIISKMLNMGNSNALCSLCRATMRGKKGMNDGSRNSSIGKARRDEFMGMLNNRKRKNIRFDATVLYFQKRKKKSGKFIAI